MRMKLFSTLFIFISLLALGFNACGGQPSQGGGKLSIVSLNPVQNQTLPGGTVVIESTVNNPENRTLNYKWSASGGGFGSSGANNIWQAPSQSGSYQITLIVEDNAGGYAQAQTSITVSNNQSPVIHNLTADPASMLPGGSTTLTCTADDPDGDIVRYSWTPSDGTISGSGNKVSWVAPNKTGSMNVTCVVDDGKGGQSKKSITLNVSSSGNTISIKIAQQESGTVSSKNDRDTTHYRAGDDSTNTSYRAFFSYDIFGLNKTNVREAKLKFSAGAVNGDPFNALTGLRLWQVNYGGGLPDYNITGQNLFYASALLKTSPNEINVTPEIVKLVSSGADRFQLEALFYKDTNSTNTNDYIEWPDVTLQITFAP